MARGASMIRGAFCLIRFRALLEVIKSPVRELIDEVARCGLSGGPVAVGTVIALDEFRSAVGEILDYDRPHFFEVRVAHIALAVAGAEASPLGSADEEVLRSAVTTWSWLVRSRDGGVRSDCAGFEDFAERERAAQLEDERVLATGDPAAVLRRADELRAAGAAAAADLAAVAAVRSWEPCGPCGRGCDWPECVREGSENCVRRRKFQPQQTLGARLRRECGEEPRAWYLIMLDFLAGDDDPWEYVTEVGADGFESRKVAQFVDGRLVCVNRENPVRDGVRLDPVPVRPWAVLEADADVGVEETTAGFFERRWAQGLTHGTVEVN